MIMLSTKNQIEATLYHRNKQYKYKNKILVIQLNFMYLHIEF